MTHGCQRIKCNIGKIIAKVRQISHSLKFRMAQISAGETGDSVIIAWGSSWGRRQNFSEADQWSAHPDQEFDGEAIIDFGKGVGQLLVCWHPYDAVHTNGLADWENIDQGSFLLNWWSHLLQCVEKRPARHDTWRYPYPGLSVPKIVYTSTVFRSENSIHFQGFQIRK